MRIAPPTPTLNGKETVVAPAARATFSVLSVEPSFTTRTSAAGSSRWILSTTPPTDPDSFQAGTAIKTDLWWAGDTPSF